MTLDQLHIGGLSTKCIIGVLPSERIRRQPIQGRVTLHLDVEKAALSGDLTDTINYALVPSIFTFVLQNGQFSLLETAAVALCETFLAVGATKGVRAVGISLTKSDALGASGCPTLELRREQRQDAEQENPVFLRPHTQGREGRAIFEGGGVQIYLLEDPSPLGKTRKVHADLPLYEHLYLRLTKTSL